MYIVLKVKDWQKKGYGIIRKKKTKGAVIFIFIYFRFYELIINNLKIGS